MKTQIKTLTMVRHGESEANTLFRQRLPRQTILEMLPKGKENLENPLSQRGKKESLELRKFFDSKGMTFDVYFCSQFLRAMQTLDICFPQVKPYIIYPDLNEINREGGENKVMLRKRIQDFLLHIDECYPGKNIVAFSHSGWI